MGIFKSSVNEIAKKAVVLSLDMKAGGKQVLLQREIEKEKVRKAIARLKCGKVADRWNNHRKVHI